MTQVFISYKNLPDRRAYTSRLALYLDANGVGVWWDEGLPPGGDWAVELKRRVQAAKIVLPLWCVESVQSEWVLNEARLGRARLLPARLQVVPPPTEFSSIHAVDLSGWRGEFDHPSLEKLVAAIFQRLRQDRKAVPQYKREELSKLPSLPPVLPPSDSEFLPSWWRLIETTTGWECETHMLEGGRLNWKGCGALDVLWAAGFWRVEGDRVRLELSPHLAASKVYEGVFNPNLMQGPGWRAKRLEGR